MHSLLNSGRSNIHRTFSTLPHAFRVALGDYSGLKKIAENNFNGYNLGKIVATIGPASEQLPMLSKLADVGLNVMRINFSHATYDEALLRISNLNKCEDIHYHQPDKFSKKLNMLGIMLDTQGPEIRTGSFAGGLKNIEYSIGDKVTITTDPSVRANQTKELLWTSYTRLADTVRIGSIIMIDDGALQLRVEDISGDLVKASAINNATLGNKKGVNLPGVSVKLPAMSQKDIDDISFGIQNDIDYIAASFVRKAEDVIQIRLLCEEIIKEFNLDIPLPRIISKIESTEGLENFEEILDASDGIMVARGDLAVEIPFETLALVQKHIVKRCNEVAKPVVVATQMLESMQKNPRPTRAEITDVTNAILEGSDCVMLSGESAQGKYPTESVATMRKIIKQSDLAIAQEGFNFNFDREPLTSEEFICRQVAHDLNESAQAEGILVYLPSKFAHHGQELKSDVPAYISKHKPNLPIFVPVPTYKAGRLLQLHKSVVPLLVDSSIFNKGADEVVKELRFRGLLPQGNLIGLTQSETSKDLTICEF